MLRRQFTGLLPLAYLAGSSAADQAPKLDIEVDADGFEGASAADIKAVVLSSADVIWNHCPATRFNARGFHVYHSKTSPVTNYRHTVDDRIAIGLFATGNTWARISFQFAHEFCHALAGHCNAQIKRGVDSGENMWFEESLCETASLFALRAMGKVWQTAPPYPNWKDYGKNLSIYAQDRLNVPDHKLPNGVSFHAWFKLNHQQMRKNSVLREKNCIVAAHLLPLFEADPEGWESVTSLNLAARDPIKPFHQHLDDWWTSTPERHRAFVTKVKSAMGA